MEVSRIAVQPPLSRRGVGPPLVLLVHDGLDLSGHGKTLDPPPLKKWAEEGYAVAQLRCSGSEAASELVDGIQACLERLRGLDSAEWAGKVPGLVTYLKACDALPECIHALGDEIAAVVSYGERHAAGFGETPYLAHVAGKAEPGQTSASMRVHHYPEAEPFFVIPAHDSYRPNSAAVAHTRTLTFLKPLVGGPYFDLEAIWEEHTKFEFAERSVEETMATMVDEPYVNHIPTVTGGIGRASLTAFYRDHFIFSNPDDTALELVSRTVGIDRVIDEFLFTLTHDRVVDWLAPGIPPTARQLSIPFTSVVNIRGDRLFHEHISWDHATLLRQLGLLPEYLPFPYALPGGKTPAPGKRFEYRLPVAGAEGAHKLTDESAVESNLMFDYGVREVDDV